MQVDVSCDVRCRSRILDMMCRVRILVTWCTEPAYLVHDVHNHQNTCDMMCRASIIKTWCAEPSEYLIPNVQNHQNTCDMMRRASILGTWWQTQLYSTCLKLMTVLSELVHFTQFISLMFKKTNNSQSWIISESNNYGYWTIVLKWLVTITLVRIKCHHHTDDC